MRADRLLTIMLMLQTRGKMTAQSLAEELDVSGRTILRDVEALSLAGVPIYAQGGHDGGIALDENYRTTLTGLNEAEIRALFVTGNSRLLNDIGLGSAAESTQRKLSAALPPHHQSTVDQVRQRIYIDPVWWWHDEQALAFWSELQQAVFQDRCILTTYERPGGEATEHVLEPYSLVAKGSVWYIIAKRDGQLRIYRAARFKQVALLDTPFLRDEGFNLETYWHGHIQEFVETLTEYSFTLRVHVNRMNFIRWLMPGRYEVVGPPDAEGWSTIEFHLESLDLARMLVFGLGKDGEVVEPQTLREAVRALAHDILRDL